ncbi:hypothetical protein P3X46_031581 [Hevea brasiliensis]|uniref:Peptidase A2 domain-containing protein n=1 Tax=Hevea brasiliensis TaxID=3981 RepID=A0ABQ9KM23_HEVBR|nr:hypothetical protein P3X46_031581 [Hevea brasiliensis]
MWIQKNGEQVKWPRKLNPDITDRRDKGKFYKFHEDHGHTIDEFITIKLSYSEVHHPYTNPLVVSVQINRYTVRRVLVDTGSSVNLLIKEVMEKLEHKIENLTKVMYPLVSLGNKIVSVLGTINLTIVLGDEGHKKEIYTEFAVIDIPLSYNIILSRLILNDNDIIISIKWICLKVPTPGGIVVVRGSQKLAHEYYKKSIEKKS